MWHSAKTEENITWNRSLLIEKIPIKLMFQSTFKVVDSRKFELKTNHSISSHLTMGSSEFVRFSHSSKLWLHTIFYWKKNMNQNNLLRMQSKPVTVSKNASYFAETRIFLEICSSKRKQFLARNVQCLFGIWMFVGRRL